MESTDPKENSTLQKNVKSENKFGGYPEKELDPDVIDMIAEIRKHIRAPTSKDGHANFVIDHYRKCKSCN